MRFFVARLDDRASDVPASSQGLFDTETAPDALTTWVVNHSWRRLIAGALLLLTEDRIYSGDESDVLDTIAEANRLIRALYGDTIIMPIGTVDYYAPEGALPSGWLLCDGSVYNVADYPLLGARLSDTYGGDGVTTFAVPDLISLFIRGTDGIAPATGALDGQDSVVLTVEQLPAHTHDYGYPTSNADFEAGGVPDPFAVGNPAITLQTSSVGSGQAVETLPAHMALRPIILATSTAVVVTAPSQSPYYVGETRFFSVAPANLPAGWFYANGGSFDRFDYPDLFDAIGYTFGGAGQYPLLPNLVESFALGATEAGGNQVGDTGGESSHVLTLAEIPAHAHNIDRSNTTGGSGASLARGAAVNNTFSTQSAGGGAAHNNMPPYLALTPAIRAIP